MLEIYNFTYEEEIAEARELLTNVKVFLKTPTVEALKTAIDSGKLYLYMLYPPYYIKKNSNDLFIFLIFSSGLRHY